MRANKRSTFLLSARCALMPRSHSTNSATGLLRHIHCRIPLKSSQTKRPNPRKALEVAQCVDGGFVVAAAVHVAVDAVAIGPVALNRNEAQIVPVR